MYKILINTHFAASHMINGYQGPCKELHGHTWKLEVGVKTEKINEIGISLDFKDLKGIIQSITERLDHHHINNVPPFDKINPTAENLAQYIYGETKRQLPRDIFISHVTIFESDSYALTYSEDPSASG